MYDNVCKFLVESYSQDFAQWLLGEPMGLTQLSPSELAPGGDLSQTRSICPGAADDI
ncbi:MAG: hypothetical protein WCA35_20755 [Kovacikia sp.]